MSKKKISISISRVVLADIDKIAVVSRSETIERILSDFSRGRKKR